MPFCKSCGNLLDLSKSRCSGCSVTSGSHCHRLSSTEPAATWSVVASLASSSAGLSLPPVLSIVSPSGCSRGCHIFIFNAWTRYVDKEVRTQDDPLSKQQLRRAALRPLSPCEMFQLSISGADSRPPHQTRYCTPPQSTSPRTRTSTTPTQSARSTPTATTTPSRTRTISQLAQPPAAPLPSAVDWVPEPLVPSHTGSSDRSNDSLTMVCGSVLSKRTPESARCAECRTFFGRGEGEDRTIYPIPGSDPLSCVCRTTRLHLIARLTSATSGLLGPTPFSAMRATHARSSETTARPALGPCSVSGATPSCQPTAAIITSDASAAFVSVSYETPLVWPVC